MAQLSLSGQWLPADRVVIRTVPYPQLSPHRIGQELKTPPLARILPRVECSLPQFPFQPVLLPGASHRNQAVLNHPLKSAPSFCFLGPGDFFPNLPPLPPKNVKK